MQNSSFFFRTMEYKEKGLCKERISKMIQTVLYYVCKFATSSIDKGKPCSYTTPTINDKDAR